MARKSAKTQAAKSERPSAAEREQIKRAAVRVASRAKRVTVRIEQTQSRQVDIRAPYADDGGWNVRLADAFGTPSTNFAWEQLNVLVNLSQTNGQVSEARVCALLAAVGGVKPENEIEAMLAVQMATTHAFAMTCLRRANGADTLPQLEANGTLAAKMLRTYAAQVEALAKLRRGGEQRVVVQHVNVNEGGQAIVGDVHNARGGGGSAAKLDQPLASEQRGGQVEASALAAGLPLWSEDAARDTVQSSCRQEQAPVPDAWRSEG